MNIEKEFIEGHQVRLTVEALPEQLEAAKRKAAREIANKVKVPGFRPGKAPYPVILRQVGEAAIVEEAMEHLVDEIYPKVIEESGVKTYGPGKLENIPSLDPPKFIFVVALDGEVKLGDYKGIRHPYLPESVKDKEVLDVLENLRDQHAVLEPVERPCQESDLVTVKINGWREEPEEGKSPTLMEENSYPIVVMSGESQSDENEWPYPGFSQNLKGLSKGEEITLDYTFPDDSKYEELRNVKAHFKALIEEVKSRSLPDLNDEFAQIASEFETLDALKANIREMLEKQALRNYDNEYDEKNVDELVELSTVTYSDKMLDDEIDNVIKSLSNRLENQDSTLDLYLKSRRMSMDDLREETKPAAEARLKRYLVLRELAVAEGITVEPGELQTETERTVGVLAQSLPKDQARKLSDERVFGNLVSNIMWDMLSTKTIEWLRNSASTGENAEQTTDKDVDLTPVEEDQSENDLKNEPSLTVG